MGPADCAQRFVGEDAVLALRERAPRLRLHAELAHRGELVCALEEGVHLDLVDRRGHAAADGKIGQALGSEVAYADRTHQPRLLQFAHGPPASPIVAKRLMDKVEVQIIEIQLGKGRLERLHGLRIASVLHPNLAGDENAFPGHVASHYADADGLLVEIRRCSVDEAIACADGVCDRLLALDGIRYLVHAEAQHGHSHSRLDFGHGDRRGWVLVHQYHLPVKLIVAAIMLLPVICARE